MNRDFILCAITPPALLLGAIWALPRLLPTTNFRPLKQDIIETTQDIWEGLRGLWPWEAYPEPVTPSNGVTYGGMTYPEGTRLAIAPGISEPFPVIPGSEDWYNQNYPGWSYV